MELVGDYYVPCSGPFSRSGLREGVGAVLALFCFALFLFCVCFSWLMCFMCGLLFFSLLLSLLLFFEGWG